MARSGTGQPTHHAQWVQGQATACLRARLDPTDEKEKAVRARLTMLSPI